MVFQTIAFYLFPFPFSLIYAGAETAFSEMKNEPELFMKLS